MVNGEWSMVNGQWPRDYAFAFVPYAFLPYAFVPRCLFSFVLRSLDFKLYLVFAFGFWLSPFSCICL
jgi:hypothetical protein